MSSAATLSRPSVLQAARRLDLNKNIGTELRGVELLSLSDEDWSIYAVRQATKQDIPSGLVNIEVTRPAALAA